MQQQSDNRSTAYGWVIVVLAAAAMVATLPGRTFGLGLITERMLADQTLQLTREQFSDINFWATLCGALFCIPVGWLLDRCGIRITLTVVVVLFGLSVIGMTVARTWWQFVLLITLTRGYGQSALSVVSISMTGKWFDKSRLPLATGVYSFLVSAGFMAAFGWARTQSDVPWRNLWGTLGYVLSLFFAPLFLLFARSATHRNVNEAKASDEGRDEEDFSFREAIATPAFWMFGIATSFYGLVSSGTSLFNESLLVERGFDKKAFYDLTLTTIPVGLFANLLTGWLAGYIRFAWLTSLAMFLLATALLSLPYITTQPQLFAYAVSMGFAGGMITVLFFLIWARLFGQAELGRIQGLAQMLTVFASALGPVVFAKLQARYGSYYPAIVSLGTVAALLAVASAVVPMPRRKVRKEPLPSALEVASST